MSERIGYCMQRYIVSFICCCTHHSEFFILDLMPDLKQRDGTGLARALRSVATSTVFCVIYRSNLGVRCRRPLSVIIPIISCQLSVERYLFLLHVTAFQPFWTSPLPTFVLHTSLCKWYSTGPMKGTPRSSNALSFTSGQLDGRSRVRSWPSLFA